MVIAEAVGHAFNDLAPVVDAFHQICPQWPAAMGQDAWQVWLEPFGEQA